MKFTHNPSVGVAYVRLSRRNLLDLLAILDDASVRNKSLVRRDGDTVAHVVAEEDADHYADRTPGPGYAADRAA